MSNLCTKLFALVKRQAELSVEIIRLKSLGSEEYSKCQGVDTADDGFGGVYAFGTRCIEQVAGEFKDYKQEPYNYISFEEFYSDAVAGDRVCEHCQLVRKYKADRMIAQRKLGYVRSALTNIGKAMIKNNG